MNKTYFAAPSILSADFSKLEEEIKTVEKAPFLHIDVMDGHFVPNITIGPLVVKSIKGKFNMVYDCHLMISDPMKYAREFFDAGADLITFHYEAVESDEKIIELIDLIHSFGIKAGISVKPGTDVKVLDKYLSLVDLILVMSVEPGFGGQKFMPNSLEKISYLDKKRLENDYKYLIQVDGGINKDTAKLVKEAGVDVIVAGTYIFKHENRIEAIEEVEKPL